MAPRFPCIGTSCSLGAPSTGQRMGFNLPGSVHRHRSRCQPEGWCKAPNSTFSLLFSMPGPLHGLRRTVNLHGAAVSVAPTPCRVHPAPGPRFLHLAGDLPTTWRQEEALGTSMLRAPRHCLLPSGGAGVEELSLPRDPQRLPNAPPQRARAVQAPSQPYTHGPAPAGRLARALPGLRTPVVKTQDVHTQEVITRLLLALPSPG